MSGPPPPPPHGGVPKGSGLPPGKYDIFVIPEHSAGSGFLYLPSLQPNVNSFAAGFASALILVAVCQSMAPAFRAWWEGFQGLGNMGLTLMVIGVGFGAWSLGRIQQSGPRYGPQSYSHDGSGGYGGTGTRASGTTGAPPPPPHGNSTPPPPPPHNDPPPQPPPQQERTKNTWEGPPPEPPHPPPQPDPPPEPRSQRPPPPPQTPPQTPPTKPQPKRPPTPQAEPPPKPKGSSWEKAREEMRKKEEERKAKEAEQRRRDEAARRLAELRAREARERLQREKEREAREQQAKERRERLEAEQRARDLSEKLEHERRERERLEREAREVREAAAARAAQEAKEAREAREREEQKQKEVKEREEKRKKDALEREERRKRLQQQREEMRRREAEEAAKREELRKKKEEEKAKAEAEAEAKAKAKAEAEAHTQARKGTSYAFSGVGEKTSMWPNGRPPAPKSTASSSTTTTKPPPSVAPSPAPGSAPSSAPANASKKPSAPSATRSNVSSSKTEKTDKTETTHSYRPYDKPKTPTPQRKKSFSSVAESESSYAPSQTTARTSPPPSMRGPYSTNDPDKIVISAVYLFMNQYAKTPASQLISGVGSVTDGLILRITTEGLFIDDDVRGVPQREWDVKAWTLKLTEVWCPPHCLNQANAAPSPAKSNPLLYKMASSRARDRGAVKPLTGDDADVYLTEMLRACKDCCQNGLCNRKFKNTNIPSPTGQAGEWKAKGLHIFRATVRDQEGKRYVFVVDESEAWKLAVGVQRLRRGTQVRQLGVQGMPASDARGTLEMLGWIS
ncbi:Fc.00g108620.m01.CDS01 [Cosmosporella sp. VM-42]